MGIEKMRWYKVIIDGQEHIVRVDDQIMKYCVIEYYDGRVWTTGTIKKCKAWIEERRVKFNG